MNYLVLNAHAAQENYKAILPDFILAAISDIYKP